MKLVRWGAMGEERPGLVDAAGAVLDLSAHLRDFGFDDLSPRGSWDKGKGCETFGPIGPFFDCAELVSYIGRHRVVSWDHPR